MRVKVRYISVLVMPFKKLVEQKTIALKLLVFCASALLPFPDPLSAELIDRVIAYVDDRAITLREFNDYYEKAASIMAEINKEDLLNTYINRILLLREAKRFRIIAPTEDELINEYIELRVRAFVRIKEEDLKDFYNSNLQEFGNQSYDSVRDKIEEYLVQRELNRLLKRHIDELRAGSYIRILD